PVERDELASAPPLVVPAARRRLVPTREPEVDEAVEQIRVLRPAEPAPSAEQLVEPTHDLEGVAAQGEVGGMAQHAPARSVDGTADRVVLHRDGSIGPPRLVGRDIEPAGDEGDG